MTAAGGDPDDRATRKAPSRSPGDVTLPPGVTLVTGATRGIGRAIVERLLARGEQVVGIARGPAADFPATLVLADLADATSTAAAMAEITSRFDIHRVVNNAGFNHIQPLGAIGHADAQQILAVNLHGTIAVTQAALPSLRAAAAAGPAARCRIVNLSSRSLLGRVSGSVYSAAKAGLVGLTRSWALELARTGITVNCVAPGPTATEMFHHNNPPGDPRTRQLLDGVPMHRMGTPAEIAGAVDYFLSDIAAFTTGQTLFVCGGASISQLHF